MGQTPEPRYSGAPGRAISSHPDWCVVVEAHSREDCRRASSPSKAELQEGTPVRVRAGARVPVGFYGHDRPAVGQLIAKRSDWVVADLFDRPSWNISDEVAIKPLGRGWAIAVKLEDIELVDPIIPFLERERELAAETAHERGEHDLEESRFADTCATCRWSIGR